MATSVLSAFGTVLLASSLIVVACSALFWLAPQRLPFSVRRVRRSMPTLGLLLVATTLVFLAALFLAQRYDIAYVGAYSSNELPLPFRVAALWAGQPGSFLLWALFGLLVARAIAAGAGEQAPLAVVFATLPVLPLLLFALMLNPFSPALDANGGAMVPQNGDGLNEILFTSWMLVHPPMLFAGYALLQAPFAFALSALLGNDDGTWVRRAMPWTLAGWAVLGFALLLGGYWAYETLGWGGYWGWDAVENSGLVPWLLATALIHAMLVRRRGGLARTTLLLALLVYIAIFYATYLTRSGVLADFSVHTFAREAIQPAMTVALVGLMVGCGAAVFWRLRRSFGRALSERMLSREGFVVLLILGILVIAAIIEFGTSVPLISAVPGVGYRLQALLGGPFPLENGSRYSDWSQPVRDGRFGLTSVFYETSVPPFGLFVVGLLTIGPLLGWRDASYRSLLRALRLPFWLAVGMTCAALLAGARGWLPLLYLALCAFALGTNAIMIRRALRGGWRRIGGYLAHVGFAVMLIGIVGSTRYASPETRVVLVEGQPLSIYGATLTYRGWRATPEQTGVLDISVLVNGRQVDVAPVHYYIPRRNATLTRPAIVSTLLRDFYLTPVQYVGTNDQNVAQLLAGIDETVGPYTVRLQKPQTGAPSPTLQLDLARGAWRKSFTFTLPTAESGGGGRGTLAQGVELTDGQRLYVEAVQSDLKQARVRIEGLNLPVTPSYIEAQVSVKPAVALVWGGLLITVAGGGIAMLRRAAENRAVRAAGKAALAGGGRSPRVVLQAALRRFR